MATSRDYRAELLEKIRQAAAELGHPPSTYEAEHEVDYFTKRSVYNHFDSWGEAMEAAGLDGNRPTECRDCDVDFDSSRAWKIHRTRVHGSSSPDVSPLEAIHELADGDAPPPLGEMARDGAYSQDLYERLYGSWKNALEAAGYDTKREAHNRVPREELLSELRRVADELGHSPTREQFEENGRYSSRPYVREFDGWTRAQEAAGLEPTRAPPGEGEDPSHVGGWDAARFEALVRDQARCQDCGITAPEHIEENGRGLDVHHKVPYREFDDPETAHELSNLVTLCRSCHSDRHSMD